VKRWALETSGERSDQRTVALLWPPAPASASSFDRAEDVYVHTSLTGDDAGLKVVKSLRLLWVFLWEGKSYPSDSFCGEIVNAWNTRGCFLRQRQGLQGERG